MALEKDLIARVERSGLGCFHLAADLVDIIVMETAGCARWDDALRSRETLRDSVQALRKRQEEENATCPDVNTEHAKPTT